MFTNAIDASFSFSPLEIKFLTMVIEICPCILSHISPAETDCLDCDACRSSESTLKRAYCTCREYVSDYWPIAKCVDCGRLQLSQEEIQYWLSAVDRYANILMAILEVSGFDGNLRLNTYF